MFLELAEKEIEEMAEKIDLNDEGISTKDQAASIVHSFLIPEVIKREKGSVLENIINIYKKCMLILCFLIIIKFCEIFKSNKISSDPGGSSVSCPVVVV